MNDALPASAATSARMVLASVALSPFLFKLDPSLSRAAILCGSFTALGYISQSLALIDTAPSTVSFLGAATVIVCPVLEWLICKKPMGLRDAPQTWAAAALCMLGVGVLEFYQPGLEEGVQVGWGDALALLQAVGFGTSFFLTRQMVQDRPDQTLPVTAVQVSVTSLFCAAWCLGDGWMGLPESSSYTLPGLFLEGWGTSSLSGPAMAVLWTGLVTTALTRMVETTALGKVSSAEASVLLAKEPLWAAAFAAWLLHSDFGMNDYVGGSLIVLACLANSLQPSHFSKLLGDDSVVQIKNQ
jgi:drug/metabolite transporter (DMT)-like permease